MDVLKAEPHLDTKSYTTNPDSLVKQLQQLCQFLNKTTNAKTYNSITITGSITFCNCRPTKHWEKCTMRRHINELAYGRCVYMRIQLDGNVSVLIIVAEK
jgi:hypothetical protein